MKDDSLGGVALIAGALGFIATMSIHPSGHDLFEPGRFDPVARMMVAAHALAVASLPVTFLGALALARRLAAPDRLGLAALVVYGFSLVAAMAAAVVSGFVAPNIAQQILAAEPGDAGWPVVLHYTGFLNQAFAQVFVAGSSAAIGLWSTALVKNRAPGLGPCGPGLGYYGLLLAPATVLALFSGHLKLDVHGFGLVVLGQAAWFITAGVLLLRQKE